MGKYLKALAACVQDTLDIPSFNMERKARHEWHMNRLDTKCSQRVACLKVCYGAGDRSLDHKNATPQTSEQLGGSP